MSTAANAAQPHTALQVYVQGAQVAVQPKTVGQPGQVETLSIDLSSGSVQVLTSSAQQGAAKEVLGILGLCKLQTGCALVVITEARHAATLNGVGVFEVVKTDIITAPDARDSSENRGLLGLLEVAVDPGRAGRGLHFSYFYDLTLTAQRIAGLQERGDVYAAQVPAQRADQRFFWNRAAARPLLAAEAYRFVLPCIMGFVEQLPGLAFKDVGSGQAVSATLTLIARRDTARSGTRQWRRGADSEGNVANFVETEQLVVVDGPPGVQPAGAVTSYVVTRGSIPLLWTQLPNIKYKPTTVIGPADVSGPAHDKHLGFMVERYKNVVAINLVNQHGTEGKLEAAFRTEAQRATAVPDSPLSTAYRYVAFDFHRECGKGRYHRLTFLWDQVRQDFEAQGFFQAQPGKGAARSQAGVMRVNCIDCLDRTNVVQGILARKALEAVLAQLGLLPTKADGSAVTLPEAYPQVEAKFKVLWADHGDAVSQQYAGTGAMKSGFTRTGKRTFMGVLDDGYKAVARYYLNNYQDGVKQDAIDLLTGAFTPDASRPLPLKPQPSPLIPIFLAFLAVAIGAHNLGAVVRVGPTAAATAAHAPGRSLLSSVLLSGVDTGVGDSVGEAADVAASITMNLTSASVSEMGGPAVMGVLLRHVALPLLLGLGLLALVYQNGRYLVNRPQLAPQLAVTVQKQPKKKA